MAGGFYNLVKYLVAPSKMPDELTWFKWEAYATWISGFALLTVIYYLATGLYMIDLEILDIEPWQAVAISLAGIAIGAVSMMASAAVLLAAAMPCLPPPALSFWWRLPGAIRRFSRPVVPLSRWG